ncbi:uncharacterized protein MELLADRAFT_108736 [Melampsora larici-populina 98AG31]|uniref:Uncharacterized protein n=1 Tax=Melampsora larici-populina (strain 98AG31 / pathotype 3-4-7) TaxID=747676 RepID=F4RU27_MELLP|nr:uncharacterized protein MELLADRAFT_108736 [Melampsora larici-populina 98AG31]EGG04102.1 hypothetical protein MELLADRAFT_108736 [Melampsora larici-populina 98AG31]
MAQQIIRERILEYHSDVGGAWGAAYAVGTPISIYFPYSQVRATKSEALVLIYYANIGRVNSALVTGICVALAVEYFHGFPRDCTRIRASVIVVVATTVVGLFLSMDLTYLRLVANETPPGDHQPDQTLLASVAGFGDIPWQDDAVALVCGSAYCVAVRKRLLILWCGILMAIIFLSTFFRAIIGLAPTDWFDGAVRRSFLFNFLQQTVEPFSMTVSGPVPEDDLPLANVASTQANRDVSLSRSSLLLDIGIAMTILSHLRRPRHSQLHQTILPSHGTGPPCRIGLSPLTQTLNLLPSTGRPSAPLLSRLLTTILTSFSLTAILMFSLLILVVAMHGTEFDPRFPKATGIFTALRLLTTPTYAVTFLYTLNRRKYNVAPTAPAFRRPELEMQLLSSSGVGNWLKNTEMPVYQPTFFTTLPAPGQDRDIRSKAIALGWTTWTSLRRYPFRRASAPLPPPIHASEGQLDSIYHTKRGPYNILYPTAQGGIVFQF